MVHGDPPKMLPQQDKYRSDIPAQIMKSWATIGEVS